MVSMTVYFGLSSFIVMKYISIELGLLKIVEVQTKKIAFKISENVFLCIYLQYNSYIFNFYGRQ